MVGEEAAAVHPGEDAGEAPALTGNRALLLRHRAELEDVDHQQVARSRTLHCDRPAERVHQRDIDVADVLGRVVVAHRPVEPLPALQPELATGPHGGHRRHVGMPPVVWGHRLIEERLGLVDVEQHLGHGASLGARTFPGTGQCGLQRDRDDGLPGHWAVGR
jgi:hypothetical protein